MKRLNKQDILNEAYQATRLRKYDKAEALCKIARELEGTVYEVQERNS